MWKKVAKFILDRRLANIIVVSILTVFMIFGASKVRMSYEFGRTLPESDSTMREYMDFLEQFGQDGSVIFLGIHDENLYSLEHFNDWYDLNEEISAIQHVKSCLSAASLFDLKKNDSTRRFNIVKIAPRKPQTQAEVDEIKRQIDNLKIYDGLIFNKDTDVTLMMIDIDKEVVNSRQRDDVVADISGAVSRFEEKNGIDVRVTGMPYIRTVTTHKMEKEIIGSIILSILIATAILLIFFRSVKTTLYILCVVLVSMLFVFGTMGWFGFKISILSGVIPPLLIIICVENSIFLLNKYSSEYRQSRDKRSALLMVIQRIGAPNLLTNATTAASFASFIITGNEMLVEFGILSSVNIFITYILTMILIPTLFYYTKPPTERQIDAKDNGFISWILRHAVNIVERRHALAYTVVIALSALSVVFAFKLETTGRVVDDISKNDILYKDLMFFEENFHGVMPYEIVIETNKPKGILNASFLKKTDRLQDSLASYSEFSRPISIAQVVKFARSAYFNGDGRYFSIPSANELAFIMKYVGDFQGGTMPDIVKSYVDDDMSKTRVSVQMANITTPHIDSINRSLKPKIEEIFPGDKYDVSITGNSVVFLEGTNYMVKNLLYSLLLAFVVITILVTFVARSFRIVIISMVPNLIPLLFTAALMGLCGISIKTSSIIVFSIALGISVDNTIHYISRYRRQIRDNAGDIRKSAFDAMMEIGPSMIASASVLICGFFIFSFSSLAATQIVGYLVPFTLLIAMTTNLIILPCLVLTINKKKIKAKETQAK